MTLVVSVLKKLFLGHRSRFFPSHFSSVRPKAHWQFCGKQPTSHSVPSRKMPTSFVSFCTKRRTPPPQATPPTCAGNRKWRSGSVFQFKTTVPFAKPPKASLHNVALWCGGSHNTHYVKKPRLAVAPGQYFGRWVIGQGRTIFQPKTPPFASSSNNHLFPNHVSVLSFPKHLPFPVLHILSSPPLKRF